MSYKELFFSNEPLISNMKDKKTIAKIFGVPFDATSTYRPGSRFGPNAIRQAFMNIEIYSTRLKVDAEQLSFEDFGDLSPTNNVKNMINTVEKVVKEIVNEGSSCITLGGEHTVTLGTYGSMPKDVALVIFDAHLDLRDEFSGLKFSHATYLKRLTERVDVKSIIHIGSRAACSEEWDLLKKIGLKTISTEAVLTKKNSEQVLRDFLKDFKDVYISIDLDVLDPSCAPAVGNPEPAGLSTHQLLEFIYTMKGMKIFGFDIVELTPCYDSGVTSVTAAKLLSELLCLSSLYKTRAF
jgi:agmatinase